MEVLDGRRIWVLLFMLAAMMALPRYAGAQGTADRDISDAVEDKIGAYRVVPVARLNISTALGVVTLSGRVNNLLAKERAVRLAQTVKGVKSVVDRIDVKPVKRPDAEIEKNIIKAVSRNPALRSRGLKVRANDAVVTISGEVQSIPEREMAKKIAMSITGVKDVRNELTVRFPKARSDRDIKNDIEQALKWDSVVERNKVMVNVKDGHVALTGTVGSSAEKTRITMLASVNGVSTVDATNLEVAAWLEPGQHPEPMVTDDEIRSAVENALAIDPRVNPFKVDTGVKDRIVTLRGIVETLEAKKAAEQDAHDTKGVVTVKNRIKVNPDQEVDDAEVAGEIRDSLHIDPFLYTYPIGVDVAGGIAYLTGTVDTFFEREEAELVASRIRGVVDLSNQIVVRDTAPYRSDPLVEGYYSYGKSQPGPRKWEEDEVLQQDVTNRLNWNPYFSPGQVKVSVRRGVVTLTGTVHSQYEKDLAAKSAFEAGAYLLVNEINVK